MNIEFLNQIFSWSSVILGIVVALATAILLIIREKRSLPWLIVILGILIAFASIGSLWTGEVISSQKDIKIQQLQPRHLTEKQKGNLQKLLSAKVGRVGFVSKIFDVESENFAEEISEVFDAAGWDIIMPINKTSLDDYVGLNIFANPPTIVFADLACNALNQVGLSCKPQEARVGSVSGSLEENAIYIVVSSKK